MESQILSGRLPYHNLRNDLQVIIELSKGIHPQRPPDSMIVDEYWEFIQECWADPPQERPSVSEVSQIVQYFYYQARSPAAGTSQHPTGAPGNGMMILL